MLSSPGRCGSLDARQDGQGHRHGRCAARIDAQSAPGFSLTGGGTLTARSAIPPFHNCGARGGQVLNDGLPGPFNSVSLTLGPARNVVPVPANDDMIPVLYPFNGRTHIHRSGSVVTLGPGTLYSLVSLNDGIVYGGDLRLPPGSGTTTCTARRSR